MATDRSRAQLTIDLAAIVWNWKLLAARHPAGETGAAVKANAYGTGAARVVPALYAAGCRHFFVATPEEGIAIRPLAPEAAIVVLGGYFPDAAADFLHHRLIPALGSLGQIGDWANEARRAGRALEAFLHLDTGMARTGLDARELDVLAGDPDRLRGVRVVCTMSHLASSEVPDDPLNRIQLERFTAARARLPRTPASLANSSGMFLGADYLFDLARPGAALYGVNPTPGPVSGPTLETGRGLGSGTAPTRGVGARRAPAAGTRPIPAAAPGPRPAAETRTGNPMRPVVSLRAPVIAVRDIPAGASVGYNATWRAGEPRRIATAAVGYADGWHLGHSNAGRAYFEGHPVPVVGRVSMDLTTFDVTGRPEIEPGSWLELLGPHCSVDDAARMAGTSPYEVLTSLGSRYQRRYLAA